MKYVYKFKEIYLIFLWRYYKYERGAGNPRGAEEDVDDSGAGDQGLPRPQGV